MKKEKLYEAIGDINENYINDAHKTVKKKSRPVWVKWGAMVACLCLVIVGALFAPNLIGEHGEEPSISSPAAIPYVKINDTFYTIDSDYTKTTTSKLTDDYVLIGRIERNPSSNMSEEILNGDAAGCKVGEEIFQSPNNLNEVYVYTTLFSGNGGYRYIRFVQNTNPN